jgi:hypothetical protein
MKKILLYFVLFFICFIESACAHSPRDLQEICQLTIDMSSLGKYFHADILPERKPLLILKNEYTEKEPALLKFGEKVKYISSDEIKEKPSPYLEFSKIEISGNSAYVDFLYPPEGLAGKVYFLKDERGWHIKSHSLVER